LNPISLQKSYVLWKLEMEQSSKNENKVSGNETCELFINEIIMEK
jgi:hypothetical protein